MATPAAGERTLHTVKPERIPSGSWTGMDVSAEMREMESQEQLVMPQSNDVDWHGI
jgi:hypothetical protein